MRTRHLRLLSCLLTFTIGAIFPAEAAVSRPKQIATKPVASKHASTKQTKQSKRAHAAAASHHKHAAVSRAKQDRAARKAASRRASAPTKAAVPAEPPKPSLPGELGLAQQAIGLVRARKLTEANTIVQSISDPVMRKLVEWTTLRHADSEARFDRYATFIQANPNWPSLSLFRRRAEGRLWQERRDGATVRTFLAGQPTSAKGRFALARVLIGEGDRVTAEREIRVVWRSAELSADLEAAVLDAFPGVLARADHAVRMDRRIGAKDFGAAMRAARRLGDDAVAIVKACAGAEANSGDARKLLDAVPGEARSDLGYTLCRIHYLQRHDDVAGAARLMLAAARDTMDLQDTDEWWRERRVLARKLLDIGEAKTAYQVVCEAASPANPYYRAEFHFMAGWIALRFLADPTMALAHFAHVDDGTTNPIVLARAAYWRGRAHEAAGHLDEMQAQYHVAARHPTAYYGQLAGTRLGVGEIELRPPPEPMSAAEIDVVRAAEILYTVGERGLALSFVTDLAEQSDNAAELAALADLAARNDDARSTLLIGKSALARGMAFDVYAFPDIGVPHYSPIGPDLDRSIVYSVVRTESEFNQRDISPAKAVGLMQVTPEAGRDTAKRFRVDYDWNRLVADPVYNTQMGSAELAALLREYRGSYIMSFAGYNAGRGRVRQWVEQYGDPRDARVDAIDWVERIPFAETRNYVQRVMENLLVYRVRFGESTRPRLESDLGTKTADDRPVDSRPADLNAQAEPPVAR